MSDIFHCVSVTLLHAFWINAHRNWLDADTSKSWAFVPSLFPQPDRVCSSAPPPLCTDYNQCGNTSRSVGDSQSVILMSLHQSHMLDPHISIGYIMQAKPCHLQVTKSNVHMSFYLFPSSHLSQIVQSLWLIFSRLPCAPFPSTQPSVLPALFGLMHIHTCTQSILLFSFTANHFEPSVRRHVKQNRLQNICRCIDTGNAAFSPYLLKLYTFLGNTEKVDHCSKLS